MTTAGLLSPVSEQKGRHWVQHRFAPWLVLVLGKAAHSRCSRAHQSFQPEVEAMSSFREVLRVLMVLHGFVRWAVWDEAVWKPDLACRSKAEKSPPTRRDSLGAGKTSSCAWSNAEAHMANILSVLVKNNVVQFSMLRKDKEETSPSGCSLGGTYVLELSIKKNTNKNKCRCKGNQPKVICGKTPLLL